MGLRGKGSQTGGGGLTQSKGFYQKTGFLAYFAKKGGWVSVNLKNLGARIFIRQLLQGIKEAWVGCAENNDAVIVIRANTAAELELLSQGEKVSEDAQAHKGELGTVTKYGISCTRYKLCDKYKRRQFSRLEAAQPL